MHTGGEVVAYQAKHRRLRPQRREYGRIPDRESAPSPPPPPPPLPSFKIQSSRPPPRVVSRRFWGILRECDTEGEVLLSVPLTLDNPPTLTHRTPQEKPCHHRKKNGPASPLRTAYLFIAEPHKAPPLAPCLISAALAPPPPTPGGARGWQLGAPQTHSPSPSSKRIVDVPGKALLKKAACRTKGQPGRQPFALLGL